MVSIETIRILLRRKYIHYTSIFRKKLLKNLDFTIISNNCWGGFIYQSYNLPYQTPTIGLYFMADDYILFLENLDYCLEANLSFIEPGMSKYYNILNNTHNFGKYPIGIIYLDELKMIEIHFLHYTNQTEALKKWNNRKKRINKDKMIIKFSDQNNCNMDIIRRFEALPYKNKVFFGTNKYTNDTIYIKGPRYYQYLPTSYEPFGNSAKFNVTKYINNL